MSYELNTFIVLTTQTLLNVRSSIALLFCKSQAICLKSDLIFVMPVVATSITAASKAQPSGAHIICVIFWHFSCNILIFICYN